MNYKHLGLEVEVYNNKHGLNGCVIYLYEKRIINFVKIQQKR